MEKNNKKRFILWDTVKDGVLRYPDQNTDGLLGRLSLENVYITTYATYPDDKRPDDLDVGECIKNVQYSLSGEHGIYDIYRVV